MIPLAVAVALIPCLCPISLVTGVETTTTPWKSTTMPDEPAVRIVGGEITSIKNYPFIVSVQRRPHSHTCGGTYIASRFILSAAHCMIRRFVDGTWAPENPHIFYVIAGTTYVYLPSWSSKQTELVDRTLPHAEFRFSNFQNDIGLFRLKRPLYRNAYVQYVTLPSRYVWNMYQILTKNCVAVGWGRHIPDSSKGAGTYLRHVRIPLIPPGQCPMPNVHRDKQVCAGLLQGGRDACQSDSGGPLLCNGIQVGIVSWGRRCGRPNTAGVYTRVDYYLPWIHNTINRNEAVRSSFQNIITIIFTFYCLYTLSI